MKDEMSYEEEQKFYSLPEIGSRMATQNHLSTQYPLWVIAVDKKIWMPHSFMWDYDGKERVNEEYHEINPRDLCESCRAIYDKNQEEDLDDELPEDCDDCDPDAFNWYKLEEDYDLNAGAFLTQAACQDHINQNHYHYHNPRPFAWSAWRNPEMIAVMQHLITASGNELPNHYA